MITLTTDQQVIADNIVDFYDTAGESAFLIKGFAGTGKSTLISEAVRDLRIKRPGLTVAIAATTNKAVKVVRAMAEEAGIACHTATIHSLLGMYLDNSTGMEKYLARGSDQPAFGEFDVVVIDEVSQLTKFMHSVVLTEVAKVKNKIILMGDDAQLPPVREKESPAFTAVDRQGELTKTLRQKADSPVDALVKSLRNSVYTLQPTMFKECHNELGGVYVLKSADWNNWINDNFASDEYAQNPDAFRVIAWRNSRVKGINRRIRKMLLGVTETPYIVGERMLARAPIMDEENPMVAAIRTDEECTVLEITEGVHPEFNDFKVWDVMLMSCAGQAVTTYLIHEDSREQRDARLCQLAEVAAGNRRMWANYHDFKDAFADVQPPHAMTAHKSQGSTYGTVFVDLVDIKRNHKRKEMWQLLHVACSRASENVVIMEGS